MTVDDNQKASVTHVLRPPIPWRSSPPLTECGLPSASHPVMTREEFLRKVKELGQRRTAMIVCMTCYDTALRHPSWQENPASCLAREVQSHWRDGRFVRELRAIAALVARHPDEFAELIEDQAEIVPIKSAKAKPLTKGK